MYMVSDTPAEDQRISFEELKYIQESLEGIEGKQRIPWKSIFKSLPVWAITVSHFSENWGFYTLLTQLPKFMKSKWHHYF